MTPPERSLPYPLDIDNRSDDDLIAAARTGDRRALDQLLRRHIDAVHAVCRRITGDAADAADATQEALVAIVRGLEGFDGRSAFSTWVYRVTTNACLDELRRRRRRPEPADEADLVAGGGPGPAIESTVAERVDVDAALRRLPDDYRAAIVLRDLCGFDYAEIAETLDVPLGTVKSRISRARAALADELARPGNLRAPGERRTERA